MIEVQKQYEKTKTKRDFNEVSKLHNLQLAKKVQLNSAYGALGKVEQESENIILAIDNYKISIENNIKKRDKYMFVIDFSLISCFSIKRALDLFIGSLILFLINKSSN